MMRCAIFISVVIILFPSVAVSLQPTVDEVVRYACEDVLSTEVSDPILMLNDSAFSGEALLRGWKGNGSPSNPFIIENLFIDANGTGYGIGISTNYSFIIRNCTILNASGGGAPLGGISILMGNGTMDNNTVSGCGYGIKAGDGCTIIGNRLTNNSFGIWAVGDHMRIEYNNCSYNSNTGLHYGGSYSDISSNIVHHNDFGIHAVYASWNRFRNNTMTFNNDHGIRLDYWSHNNTVTGNHAFRNDDGIMLERGSSDNLIVNNSVTDCEEGLFVHSGYRNIFFGNRMCGCSFYFGDEPDTISTQTIPGNNTVCGYPVRYFGGDMWDGTLIKGLTLGQVIAHDVEGLVLEDLDIPSGSAGVILFDCLDTAISGCNISEQVYEGIKVEGCVNTTINGCGIAYSDTGIELVKSMRVSINNSICQGSRLGCRMADSSNIDLSFTVFLDDQEGLLLSMDLENVWVKNCTFRDMGIYAIRVESPDMRIHGNMIGQEDMESRHGMGVIVQDVPCYLEDNDIRLCEVGIKLEGADHSELKGNSIMNCVVGIHSRSSEGEIISENLLGGISETGLFLEDTRGSIVRGNRIEEAYSAGILLSNSHHTDLFGNSLLDTSIDLFYSEGTAPPQNEIPVNNTVDGIPVHYYEGGNLDEIILPDSAGELILMNTEGGTLEGVNLSSGNIKVLVVSSNGLLVRNSSFHDGGVGIRALFSDDITASGCSFRELGRGMDLNHCDGFDVRSCTFGDIQGIGIGAYLSSGTIDNSLFDDCATGADMMSEGSSTVSESMFRNGGDGIRIDGVSRSVRISSNSFFELDGYGVWIRSGAFTRVRDNAFVNTGLGLNGTGTVRVDSRDNEVSGNYYWHHLFPDEDHNGYVEEPYNIEGDVVNVTDDHPRSWLPEVILGAPGDISAVQSLDDVLIEWNGAESSPFVPIKGYVLHRYGNGTISPWTYGLEGESRDFFLDEGVAVYGNLTYSLEAYSDLGFGPAVRTEALIDTAPLEVKFLNGNGSAFNSTTFTLFWSSSFPPEDIIFAEIILDDGARRELVNTSVREHTFDGVDMGYHTATLNVRDRRGYSSSAGIRFLVDWEKPRIGTLHSNGWTNDTLSFLIGMDDNIGVKDAGYTLFRTDLDPFKPLPINETWYRFVTGEDVPPLQGCIPVDEGVFQWLYEGEERTIDFENLTEGNYTLFLWARDPAGNAAWSSCGGVVDRTPPEVISFHPAGTEAPIEPLISVELSEVMESGSVMMSINGISARVESLDGNAFRLFPEEPLEWDEFYTISFSGRDRASNPASFSWTFRTMKDPDWTTRVFGSVMFKGDYNGKRVQVVIDGKEEYIDLIGSDNGFILELGPGNHTIIFRKEGFVNATLELNITYGQGPVDLGVITLQTEDQEGKGEAPPYITYLLGVTLIIITVIIALSAFRRKGGPFEE